MELGTETILVRRSGLQWAELVVDGAKAKGGAVARGIIFDSNSALACNKALFRSSS